MAEAIHCPSCSTRYRLRPERLKASTRRARCLTCQGIFPVGDVVRRLLATDPDTTSTTSFRADQVAAAHDLEDLEALEPPSLTLGDLEGAEAEILEKTLVEAPPDLAVALPEVKPEPVPPPAPSAFPPEITESTLSGYTSARDAIEKLFGDSPALVGGEKAGKDRSSMDVEATLSALEATLGGTHPTPPSALPEAPFGEGSTDAGTVPPSGLSMPPSTSTVRFTRDEVIAAMAEGGPSTPMVPAAPASEPTVALRASDLMAAPDQTQAMAAARTLMTGPLPIPAPPAPGTPEAELLRLKIGEEIYPGLTMSQLTQWVEEGRILEGHLVARQFSEHWLEAHKVPGLRPVFERLRRERSAAPGTSLGDEFPPPSETAPMKKSLFGGLFGGKN